MSPAADPIAGQEPNLSLHPYECARCGEPMLHLCEIWSEYPLCRWWRLTCGECGSELDAWEDLPVPIQFPVPQAE